MSALFQGSPLSPTQPSSPAGARMSVQRETSNHWDHLGGRERRNSGPKPFLVPSSPLAAAGLAASNRVERPTLDRARPLEGGPASTSRNTGGWADPLVLDHGPATAMAIPVSSAAERFARANGLWGWLVVMRAFLSQTPGPVIAADVDLASDPDLGTRVIRFALRSNGEVAEILDYDERLRDLIVDQIPPQHQVHFAIRFDLL